MKNGSLHALTRQTTCSTIRLLNMWDTLQMCREEEPWAPLKKWWMPTIWLTAFPSQILHQVMNPQVLQTSRLLTMSERVVPSSLGQIEKPASMSALLIIEATG